MKILIVGGGIGGPALASFLDGDPRFEVTLAEQAPEFKNIGFGISLWPNGRSIIDRLGLGHVVDKEGYELPWTVIENKKGRFLNSASFQAFSEFGGTVTLPRSSLHGALIAALKKTGTRLMLNAKVVSCVDDGRKVRVGFADGSKGEYDLVVGADGIHSVIRDQIFGEGCLREYGWSMWVFWVPDTGEFSRGIIQVLESGHVCYAYPTLDKCFMLVAGRPEGVVNTPEERLSELKKISAYATPGLRQNIERAEATETVFFDKIRYVKAPLWYKDRVVLMGDAKHAASPLTGMGASLSLEDAFVLAEELKARVGADSENLDAALAAYARRRDARVRLFRRLCRRFEGWVMVKGFKGFLRDLVLSIMPSSYFTKPFKRLLASKI